MIRLKEKGTTLTWGTGPSSDPGSEAIAAPAAAAIAVAGVPRVITPRWWWWRRDRRTDAPLSVVGLGAGLLGPTCSLLVLLGGFKTSDPSVRRSLRRLSSSDPPKLPEAEAPLAAPLPLSKGLGATAGLALRAKPVGWGPPTGASEIRIPRWESWPPVWRTATPLSSRVGNVAKIVVLRPGSSQSIGMFKGSIRDSGTKVSPVIPPTRTASSSQDRSVPGPCWILPMSFGPVNQQHRRGLLCCGTIWRFRRLLTMCIDVKPPVAKPLILSNTDRNSGERDGLVLHCLRSSASPSLGRTRWRWPRRWQSPSRCASFPTSHRQRWGCRRLLDLASSGSSRHRCGP
jgi:hypothetical protein